MANNINSSENIENSPSFAFYLLTNVHKICRVCLEKSNQLVPIFDPVKPPHFSVMMMACANIQVFDGDNLPQHICNKCIPKLNLAFTFKSQCELADAKLHHYFQNYALKPAEVQNTLETKQDFGKRKSNTFLETQIEETFDETPINRSLELIKTSDLNVEPHYVISEPQQEEDDHNIYNSFSDTDNLKSDKVDCKENDFSIKENDREENFILCDESKEEANLTCLQKASDRKSKKPKVYTCHTCGKTFHLSCSLKHHIRTHTGERPYACRLCQKRFKNGGHLHTHMKTHTGEKNHVCAICSKPFTTAQQLTKHTIAVHTSERPYECTYCKKRFASAGNLSTHLKIHTGEKNFYCEVCARRFCTKAQLLQHNLVHTGEKAFLCECCEKRFAQKAHLVRHLKTHRGIHYAAVLIKNSEFCWECMIRSSLKTRQYELRAHSRRLAKFKNADLRFSDLK